MSISPKNDLFLFYELYNHKNFNDDSLESLLRYKRPVIAKAINKLFNLISYDNYPNDYFCVIIAKKGTADVFSSNSGLKLPPMLRL